VFSIATTPSVVDIYREKWFTSRHCHSTLLIGDHRAVEPELRLQLQASNFLSSGINVQIGFWKFLAPVPEWFGQLQSKNHNIICTTRFAHKLCFFGIGTNPNFRLLLHGPVGDSFVSFVFYKMRVSFRSSRGIRSTQRVDCQPHLVLGENRRRGLEKFFRAKKKWHVMILKLDASAKYHVGDLVSTLARIQNKSRPCNRFACGQWRNEGGTIPRTPDEWGGRRKVPTMSKVLQ